MGQLFTSCYDSDIESNKSNILSRDIDFEDEKQTKKRKSSIVLKSYRELVDVPDVDVDVVSPEEKGTDKVKDLSLTDEEDIIFESASISDIHCSSNIEIDPDINSINNYDQQQASIINYFDDREECADISNEIDCSIEHLVRKNNVELLGPMLEDSSEDDDYLL